MRFIVRIILLFLITSVFGYSQEVKDRLYLSLGFIVTKDKIEESDFENKNVLSRNSLNMNGSISYEHYFTHLSGIEVFIGYNNLSRAYFYKLDPETIFFLSDKDLSWNEGINIPFDQHFFSTRIGYILQNQINKTSMLSFVTGLHYRVSLKNESIISEYMFYQNNEDFDNTIGPKSYTTLTQYNQHIFNPYLNLKYERKTTHNNTYGMSLNFNIPFIKSHEGRTIILPEFDDHKSQFNYYSRGSFWGITIFYGICFNNK